MTGQEFARAAHPILDTQFAEQFAAAWYDGWNRHDLQGSLEHYTDDFEQHSPSIAALAGEPSGVLVGLKAVEEHWRNILARYPTLRLDPLETYLGVSTITLVYRINGRLGSETFLFDADRKVCKAFFHWAI